MKPATMSKPLACLDVPIAAPGTYRLEAGIADDRLGRDGILIELKPEYVELARKRLTEDAPLFTELSE